MKVQHSFNFMQRYSIQESLVAIRLYPSSEADKAGEMSSLPSDAIVVVQGPSNLGRGMIEVFCQDQRYVVFERDLMARAVRESVEGAVD